MSGMGQLLRFHLSVHGGVGSISREGTKVPLCGQKFFKKMSWMECMAISITDAIWSPYSFSCPADCPGLYCTVKKSLLCYQGLFS